VTPNCLQRMHGALCFELQRSGVPGQPPIRLVVFSSVAMGLAHIAGGIDFPVAQEAQQRIPD
jgi:hypothetical protein